MLMDDSEELKIESAKERERKLLEKCPAPDVRGISSVCVFCHFKRILGLGISLTVNT